MFFNITFFIMFIGCMAPPKRKIISRYLFSNYSFSVIFINWVYMCACCTLTIISMKIRKTVALSLQTFLWKKSYSLFIVDQEIIFNSLSTKGLSIHSSTTQTSEQQVICWITVHAVCLFYENPLRSISTSISIEPFITILSKYFAQINTARFHVTYK